MSGPDQANPSLSFPLRGMLIMPSFSYLAMDQVGKRVRGRMEAASDAELELRIKRQGLDLITCRLAKPLFERRHVSRRQLIMFCFEMEQLIRVGFPLLQGLADLREAADDTAMRSVLGRLVSALEGGRMLSQGLAQEPQIFNPVFVSVVHAGEQSGRLAEAFEQLGNAIKWQDDLLAQARRIMVYPAFIFIAVLGSTVFLMTYLMPQMASFLQNMGREIPVQTRMLMAVSDGAVHWWWTWLAGFAFGAATLILVWKRSLWLRQKTDELTLRLPLLGGLVQKLVMARLAHNLALMYQAGIPLLDAIGMCRDIAGNRAVAVQLDLIQRQIATGMSLSESFAHHAFFPPLVIRMLRIGETTATLDTALLNVAYFYDRDVRHAIESLLKLLEPALTVILGGLLALVVYLVLGPVYASLSEVSF